MSLLTTRPELRRVFRALEPRITRRYRSDNEDGRTVQSSLYFYSPTRLQVFFWQCQFVEAGYMRKRGSREFIPIERKRPEVHISTFFFFCCRYLLTRILLCSAFFRLFLYLRWSTLYFNKVNLTIFQRLYSNQYVWLCSQQLPSHCSDRKSSKVQPSLGNQRNSSWPRMIPIASSVCPRNCLWK
jgi:hypothetical protein